MTDLTQRDQTTIEDKRITAALVKWVERRAELGAPVPEEVVKMLTRAGLYVPGLNERRPA